MAGLMFPLFGVSPVFADDYDRVLFGTDFAEFEAGADTITGVDGWECNHPATQSHGIVEDRFDGIGKSGYVGQNAPDGDWVSVFRTIDYERSGTEFSAIHFSVSFAIFDSGNERYDSFYLSLYDSETRIIAAVIFDNTEENYGVWRYDGKDFTPTLVDFDQSRLHRMAMFVDRTANTWTAKLDDTVLFEDAPFHTGDLGTLPIEWAMEWELTDPEDAGDNWMLFDDLEIVAVGLQTPPLGDLEIRSLAGAGVELEWPVDFGWAYQVQHSEEGREWLEDLPGLPLLPDSGQTTARYHVPFFRETHLFRIRRFLDNAVEQP